MTAIAAPLLPGAAGLIAGVLLGLWHFGSLHWTVRLYVGGRALGAGTLHVLRLVLLTAALAGLAWAGAPALLGGGLGLLAARQVVLYRAGGTPWARR